MSEATETGGPGEGTAGVIGDDTSSIGSLLQSFDWKLSLAAGVGTWIATLVVSYAIVVVSGIADRVPGEETSTLDVAAWVMHNSLGGFLDTEGFFQEAGSSYHANLYSSLDSNFFGAGLFVHYLLPILVLVLAGYLLANRYEEQGVPDSERLSSVHLVLLGGMTLAVGFALMTVVGSVVFDQEGLTFEGPRLLLAGLVYPVVFGGIGAARAAGVKTKSLFSFLAGLGAFVVGFFLWYFIESPLYDVSLSDLGGAGDYLGVFGLFVSDHGIVEFLGVIDLGAIAREAEIDGSEAMETAIQEGPFANPEIVGGGFVPGLPVILGLVIGGAVLAYRAETTDWLVGAGKGARIAAGYVVAVFVVVLATYVHRINQIYEDESFFQNMVEEEHRQMLIDTANELFGGFLPAVVIVAGVLWPVVFGGLGGAIGSYVVQYRQQSTAQTGATGGEPAE